MIIFFKAGEEWTTIAKTKGKKKTKPEDEWQEVKLISLMINHILATCLVSTKAHHILGRLGAGRKIGGERSQRRLHLTPINSKPLLSSKVVKEVAGDEVEGMEAVVAVEEIGVVAEEEEDIKEVVALFLGRTPEVVGGLHLELQEVEEV